MSNQNPIFRSFLKDDIRLSVDFSCTPQNRGVPAPPLEKPRSDPAAPVHPLVRPGTWKTINPTPLTDAIARRRSHRAFTEEHLSLEELSYLLWATQGIRKELGPGTALRTVPSAGARHAFETYIAVFRVDHVEPGVYRYLPRSHELLLEFNDERTEEKLAQAALAQQFVATAAAVFIWTVIPYRMEWRYGDASYKVIALDAGHVCQNLYLACEAINAGTCAIAAYHQQAMDAFLRVDGDDEFTVYLAPVGKIIR